MENVHVVWLQAEYAQTSPVDSPTSSNPASSPSAVGVFLERLSVAPISATPRNGPAVSPIPGGRSGGGSGSDASSPKRSASRSPNRGAYSPKARAQRGGGGSVVSSTPETPGVKKDIKLDGLSAYTKESTTDWVVIPENGGDEEDSDPGSTGGDRRRLHPLPPVRSLNISSGATHNPAASSSSASAFSAAGSNAMPNSSGRDFRGNCEHSPKSDYKTTPLFILRPLGVRGTLVVQESMGSVQTSNVPTADPGYPGVSGEAEAGGDESSAGSTGLASEGDLPPLAAVSLDVDAVALQVGIRQYAVLNEAVSALAMSSRRFRFRSGRPTTAVLDDPEAWWRYAIM